MDLPQELTALVESADEAAARRRLAELLGDGTGFNNRPWSAFPVRSLAAFVLLRAAQWETAATMAVAALRAHGSDELLLQILPLARLQFHHAAVQALYKKRLDRAQANVADAMRLFTGAVDLAPERALGDLFAYIAAIPTRRGAVASPAGRPTLIHVAAWGDRYVDAALRMALPCCLAPGNVPALRAHGAVVIQVHTREDDIARLRDHAVTRALAQHATIEFVAVPAALLDAESLIPKPIFNRMVLGTMQHEGLITARGLGADFTTLPTDLLLSNRCLSAAKEKLIAGYQAVVTAAPRALTAAITPAMEAARQGTCIDIAADALYRASIAALHPVTYASFMRQVPTLLPMDPTQLFFPMPGGFCCHAFHLHPMMLATRRLPADFACDAHTLDARLLSDVLQGLDRDQACYVHAQPPGDMYLVAVEEHGSARQFTHSELSPEAAVEAALGWVGRYEDVDYLGWAVRQRIAYRVPADVAFALPADCRDAETTVTEIVRLLSEKRLKVFSDLNRYRH